MNNRNWPTLDKIIPQANQIGALWYRSGSADDLPLVDGFTDVGASPLSNQTMVEWMIDGLGLGFHLRKPHAYYDDLRDDIYPALIGEHLGMGDDARVFYSNSGTEAIEAALKLVRKATGRQCVYGIVGDFHGRTYGALGLHYDTLEREHPAYHFDGFGEMVPGTYAIDEAQARELIGKSPLNDLAAFVISPIQGNNTLEDTPAWVWEFAAYARSKGVLIVFDEVQTGFGRGGGVVSVTEAGWWPRLSLITESDIDAIIDVMVSPDVYVFGKACGAGWPMSLTVCSSTLADVMSKGTHFNTMSGSPLGCYMSARLIETLEDGLLEEMLDRAERLCEAFPQIIRRGYMMAIETDDPYALCSRAKEHGLILMTARPNKPVRLSPPFHMDHPEEQRLFQALSRTLST